jgi:hypothetical protein
MKRKHDKAYAENKAKKIEKEDNCYDTILDSIFWIFGFLDGCTTSYLLDCFSKENFTKGHMNSAEHGFVDGFIEGDTLYEYSTFHY